MYSFGRILQVMLRKQYPGTNFEVITAAMAAINSHAVLQIAEDATKYDPDLFVVYLGNNEVVGPYGAGTVFAPVSDNLSLIRFQIALKSMRVGQLLTNLTGMMGSDSPKVWMGMEMFLDKQIRKSNKQINIVYQNYRRNLSDICKVALKNNIPIICSTVGCNLKDNPPFASKHRLDILDSEKKQWEDLYKQGIALEDNKEYSVAIEIYLKAAQIDPDFANLQYRLGQCYWQTGEFEESKNRFILARELDTLRFRADNQINEIIGEVAGNKISDGIYLVDSRKVFEDNSPNGIPGQELFYEHVHLKFNGNYLLAKTIFRQVEEILPERIKNKADKPDASFPSKKEVARYLAYTDFEKHRIARKVIDDYLTQPPFTNQLYHKERIELEEKKVKSLKDALTEDVLKKSEQQIVWAIQQTPSDPWLYWKYGLLLESQENISGAAMQYEMVLKYDPTHYYAYARLGLCYGFMGDINKAIEYNLKAIKLFPNYAVVYYNLGIAYHLQEKYDKAIKNYKKAIDLNPKEADVYYNYALLFYEQRQLQAAIDILRVGLKYVPNDSDLHYGMAIMLNAQGQSIEAINELREALKLNPDNADAREALDALLN